MCLDKRSPALPFWENKMSSRGSYALIAGSGRPSTCGNRVLCSRWGQLGSNARKTVCMPYRCNPDKLRLLGGRRDRNRTCTLRSWSTRRAVQRRLELSKSPLDSRILTSDRPTVPKHVQPVCSQFCSQTDLYLSMSRRLSHELECSDCTWTPQSSWAL